MPPPGGAEPSHIRRLLDDRKVMCGEKDALPVTLARHVQAHIDGRGAEWCPACLTIWEGENPMSEPGAGRRAVGVGEQLALEMGA